MKTSLLFLTVFLAAGQLSSADTLTLRSLGLKGNGVTDERAALQQALVENTGKALDGEGLTYAVDGTVDVRADVDLRNATLKQIAGSFDTSKYIRSARSAAQPAVIPADALTRMAGNLPVLRWDGAATYPEDPAVSDEDLPGVMKMLNIRTLFLLGDGRPLTVKLENVKILRGDHADAGMHSNSAGLYIVNANPLTLRNVEISGAGKGSALFVTASRNVKMDGVNVHDVLWSPYRGDIDIPVATLGEDFGWNNSPIYDFDEKRRKFIRVRIQEQTNGISLGDSQDIEVVNCRIDRVGTVIDGRFIPWQADGLSVGNVKNLVIRDCVISNVWEGIDFTGAQGVDGFVQENVRISDTFSYSFKYAHPQKNGKVINCTSDRAGLTGFVIGAESDQIEFLRCTARETGSNGFWKGRDGINSLICGFSVDGYAETTARGITIKDCVARNEEFPEMMAYGFFCAEFASQPEYRNVLIHPVAAGAYIKEAAGFAPAAP